MARLTRCPSGARAAGRSRGPLLSILLLLAPASPALPATPRTPAARSLPAAERAQVRAMRLTAPVTVDGILSEAVWQSAEPFTGLVQRDPVEGGRPSQATEVRVAYDEDAIYIGARLHDSAPDSIAARLARRDASIASDRFAVYLDPYHDRRSGYYFMVNAAGTLYDGTLANDVDEDKSWDGVWEGKARTDERGWTVEIRIPYSQLRISKAEPQVWGINFAREIPRRREKDYAAYRPRKESSFVSRFPDLVGIQSIAPGAALELMPYVTAQSEFTAPAPGDPFNDGSRTRGNAGGDLRARVAGMKLSATVNPDFGQVEVDPASVNLTDVETFLEEKRPFFVEGSSSFAFGRQGAGDYWDLDWEDPLFFYSRRIGRTPQGKVPKSEFSDVPVATSILGAAKLSGRPAPGWSLGTLHALTDEESAQLAGPAGSWQSQIEPLTYYGVTRAQRELGSRRSGIGLMGTLAARSFDDPRLRDQFNSASLMGGVDGWLFLDSRRVWALSGWSAISHIEGNPTRMIAVQRSSTHYFQRPDEPRYGVDSIATQLSGWATRYWLNKQKGALLLNAGFGVVSPGFEVNDLGFQKRSDLVNGHLGTGYKWTRATRLWRYQTLKAAVFATNDQGGHPLRRGVQASGYTEFHNGHTLNYYATWYGQTLNNRRTRGGPLTLELPGMAFGNDYLSDTQRRSYYFASLGGTASRSGSWSLYAYPGMEWKPTANFSFKVTPGFEFLHEDAQFVTSASDPAAATYGRRYVFGALDQTTASASLRLNWTFTPRLGLETYVQPFVSSAAYRDFKTLDRPESYEFTPTTYNGNLDFTVWSLKGNAVLRWEYRPGSAMFLVWTQRRSDYEDTGTFSLGLDRLANVAPENVLMAKVSYYFSR